MDSAAIEEVLHQYGEALSSGNFDLWLSLWIENGRQMPPDTPARIGKGQIRKGMRPLFEEMDMTMVISSIEESRIIGDFGLTRCLYNLKGITKSGGEVVQIMPDGKALTLYEKQPDGIWKIAYDCFNSNINRV